MNSKGMDFGIIITPVCLFRSLELLQLWHSRFNHRHVESQERVIHRSRCDNFGMRKRQNVHKVIKAETASLLHNTNVVWLGMGIY